jgi:hypothetical protein
MVTVFTDEYRQPAMVSEDQWKLLIRIPFTAGC